ncbi:hypothetical protein IscW_ISCW000600 [Ixodes scapularis]|uniref:Uncharacterized protein n=1 Tax=Ixodes scapularis TaxID=6945 RepID=B7P3S7_IXOSC|nr:hypothetical protein IscW_ISCW000600 [Ixodes scapularis]|eukprot:XP_002404598.1 hypothetical protein IscW_ISCW000600 [Ixodes scapularis]
MDRVSGPLSDGVRVFVARRRKQDEVQLLEHAIGQRCAELRKVGGEQLVATCQICLKTKFADGIGHICNYCDIRCCARCGGKVSLRSSKVIWVCILCRKKQELLIKTGQWVHSSQLMPQAPGGQDASAARARRLERAHSAEKDNYTAHAAPPGLMRLVESVVRNDSLSSDQSECVRPPPPKPHRHKRGRKMRQRSLSSSDDEVRSTPDCSSCEESESVSEKGDCVYPHAVAGGGALSGAAHSCAAVPSKAGCLGGPGHPPFTGGKKTVRFNRDHGGCRTPLPDALTKDSGIDTSSSATLNEDLCLKHPASWKPSADGTRMLGHMILKKNLQDGGGSSAAILGLKVVGGKILESGKLGALVEKVKKGSIADTVGHLRPGDEVLEWNGRSLQGKTYEEVYDIISESKMEMQVELIVSRPLRLPDVGPQASTFPNSRRTHPGTKSTTSIFVALVFYKSVLLTRAFFSFFQIKLEYNAQTLQLVVVIICATELPPKTNGQPRNPYVKMVLLQDRSEKSKRRTRTLAGTNEPRWNQRFSYSPLRKSDLINRALEVTVWDYDRYGANDFLGEIVLELATANLHGEAEWYPLGTHDENLGVHYVTPYVKVYLINGRKCIAKAKTATARRTLDPLYQQVLIFNEDYRGCVLQVTVYGEYGRMDKKAFMGAAQVMLDDLNLTNMTIGWYKLFPLTSLVMAPASQGNSLASMDSFG